MIKFSPFIFCVSIIAGSLLSSCSKPLSADGLVGRWDVVDVSIHSPKASPEDQEDMKHSITNRTYIFYKDGKFEIEADKTRGTSKSTWELNTEKKWLYVHNAFMPLQFTVKDFSGDKMTLRNRRDQDQYMDLALVKTSSNPDDNF